MRCFIALYECLAMLPRKNKNIIRFSVLSILAIIMLPSLIYADAENLFPADSLSLIDTSIVVSEPENDTVQLLPELYQIREDSLVIEAYLTENTRSIPKRSPSMTMLKSVAFPGWGQYSNKKYFRAGVIFLIESHFIYKAVDFGIKASDARKDWRNLPDSLASQKAEAFRIYADYRDSRNSNIWYAGITIFFSMIDAYVDAHLQDFPPPVKKSNDISIELSPGEVSTIAIVYQF